MLCCVYLDYVVLCSPGLCCAVFTWTMLCCVYLDYIVLRSAVRNYVMLCQFYCCVFSGDASDYIVDRMTYLLMETTGSSYGYFDFRINAGNTINGALFQTVQAGAWGTQVLVQNINSFPFLAGNDFTLTFLILDQTSLRVRYQHVEALQTQTVRFPSQRILQLPKSLF